jgi:hypothetical protein
MRSPSLRDIEKTSATTTIPASLSRPMAVIPTEATHPHSEQTGLPPNWHVVMRVARSADRHSVLRAKMHSAREAGGRRYPSKTYRGSCTSGKRCAHVANSFKARARSPFWSCSAKSLTACGVNRLNQILRAFERSDQKRANSAR